MRDDVDEAAEGDDRDERDDAATAAAQPSASVKQANTAGLVRTATKVAARASLRHSMARA